MSNITPWTGKVDRCRAIWEKDKPTPYREKVAELISARLYANPKWTLLDAGCGTGMLYKYLPDDLKERYIGIDFTGDMIDFCRKTYPEGDFRLMSIFDFAIIPEADIVVTQNVLQHILAYQVAMFILMQKARNCVVFLERTHDQPTVIVGYDPVRYRFFREDILNCMRTFGWGPEQEPEMLAMLPDVQGDWTLGLYIMERR
jgi:SAM-dependent methyltransferase